MRFAPFLCVVCSVGVASSSWALQVRVEDTGAEAPAALRLMAKRGHVAVSAPESQQLWLVGEGATLDIPTLDALKPLGVANIVPLTLAETGEDTPAVKGVALHFTRGYPWHIAAVTAGGSPSYLLQRGRKTAGNLKPSYSVVQLKDSFFVTKNTQAAKGQGVTTEDMWQVRHPETGQVLHMLPLVGGVPALPFAEQGDFQNIWGLAWDAGEFLVESRQGPAAQEQIAFNWQRNPMAVPKAEVMMAALPQLGAGGENLNGFSGGKSPAVLAWVKAEDLALSQQIPDYIQKPYQAGEALRFTPIRAKKDPKALERAFKFADAAGALRLALEKVEEVQPSGVRAAGTFVPMAADAQRSFQGKNEGESVSVTVPAQGEPSVLNRGDAFLIAIKDEPGKRFREQEAEAIYKLGLAGTNPVLRDEAITDLARVYLNFQRPRQALVTLEQTVIDKDGFPVSAMARTLMGAAQVLDAQGAQALATLKRGVEPHRALWHAAALAQLGRLAEVETAVEDHTPVVQVLPAYMQTHLYKVEAERLLAQQKYSDLEDFIDRISTLQYNGETPRELNYVLARSNLELGNTERGRELLSAVSQMPSGVSSRADALAVEAKYDFLRDLARTGDIGAQQEILFLEDLQFDWRGDKTEGKILKRLGELYAGTRQYRSALDHLKTYAVAFPDSADIDEVTKEMRDTFVAIFQPENRDLLDRLGLLGMYYDFRELTPADLRGDYVVETVAQELDTALLYRRAADLFENQLTYRLTGQDEKVAMAAELAALYRKGLDPNLAIATLQAYQPKGVSYEIKQAWDLEAARVYLALNQPEKARTFVADYVDDYAQDVLVDIAWTQGDYGTIARVLSLRYDTAEHEGFESIRVRSDFIRLAYALVQLGQRDALAQLVTNYKDPMQAYPEVADIVNVYATQLKLGEDVLPIIRGRPLQQIAQKLMDINAFEAGYNARLETRQNRHDKREEYNSKMKYMKFLEDEGII